MPQPYSADLRERVLVAYEQGEGSQVAIGRRFRVCPATVCNWIRQARRDGRRSPKPHRGGPAGRLGSHDLPLLRGLMAETNDAYLDQYAERLFALTGKRVSRPVMCRTLQRLKLTVKKARTAKLTGRRAVREPQGKRRDRVESGCAGFARGGLSPAVGASVASAPDSRLPGLAPSEPAPGSR
jgi:transposase